MAKPDFPALLAPGVHVTTLPALQALAVAPFPLDAQRQDLYLKLTTWMAVLQAVGVGGILWIDGSFLTQKPGPGDIDCVLWNPGWADPANATATNQQRVQHLLDHATAQALYGLDLYIEAPAPNMAVHREAYWRGFLGFCHDRVTAKGFAELPL